MNNIVSLLSEAPHPDDSRLLDAGIDEIIFSFTVTVARLLAIFHVTIVGEFHIFE